MVVRLRGWFIVYSPGLEAWAISDGVSYFGYSTSFIGALLKSFKMPNIKRYKQSR